DAPLQGSSIELVIDQGPAAARPADMARTVRGVIHGTLLLLLACMAQVAIAAEPFDIGLAADGTRIDAFVVPATGTGNATRTVALVGGLASDDAGTAAVREAVSAYAQQPEHPFQLLAVPLANHAGIALRFPPEGTAYGETPEPHAP